MLIYDVLRMDHRMVPGGKGPEALLLSFMREARAFPGKKQYS